MPDNYNFESFDVDESFNKADKVFKKVGEGDGFEVFRANVNLNDPDAVKSIIGQIKDIVERTKDTTEDLLRENTAYCEPHVIDKIIELTGLRRGDNVADDLIALAQTDMNPHEQLFIHYFIALMYDGLVEMMQKAMSKQLFISLSSYGKFSEYVSVGSDEQYQQLDDATQYLDGLKTDGNMPKWPDKVASDTPSN